MKNRKYPKIALSLGLLLGAVAPMGYQTNGHAETKSNAMNILASLSKEQREALQKLEANRTLRGLQLSRDIDLTSKEEVTVIVEFDQLPAKTEQIQKSLKGEKISLEKAKKKVEESHEKFKKDLQAKIGEKKKSSKEDYKIKYTYKNALNGVALTLPANEIENLLESEVVKAVYSELEVQLTPPPKTKTKEEEGSTTKVDSIPFLNIDKLHKEGFTGEGVKVGVIDTGVDYNHPDLKEAYKGGYDFVDNDDDPMETTYEEWKKSGYPETNQGSTYYTEHGTHVSGTIVGQAENDSDYKVIGVAPDAELHAYRVLGKYGSGSNSAVIAGVDRAVADGMDVINLSLGASTNNPLDASSLAVDNAVLSGVTAVVAAGNTGELGNSTLGSPGAAALALTVGASSASSYVTTYESKFSIEGQELSGNLQLMTQKWTDDFSNLKGETFEIVEVGEGGLADYKDKDVNGKIAFVVRGSHALIDKMKYAKQNGAAGVIIYNNNAEEGHIPHYLGESNDNIPTFSLSNKDGLAVKELFHTGTPTITLGEVGKAEISGDELAYFSSKGPSGTLYDIKPEVTAPGVNILSTVPSYIQNKEDQSDYSYAYQRLSGTSMASPQVAGIAALLLQAHPDYTPSEIKSVLMNTADPLKNQYSVYEVGAGRVDPMQAIHSDTVISVLDETPYIENGEETIIPERTGGLSYGFIPMDNENIIKTTNLSISNTSKENKKYNVSVEYNVGASASGSLDAKKNGVKLNVPKSIKVKKNKEERFNAFLTIPKTAKKGTYEGYIYFENKKDPKDSYRIPFGAKVVEEGIGYFKVYTPSISTNRVTNPYSRKATDLDFKLNSPMERLDWVLVNPETKEELGWILGVDATGAAIDYDYYLDDGFAGYYYPFTGHEKKPISYTKVRAEDGIYEVKMIGTAKDGKQYEKSSMISLENGAPTVMYDDTNAIPAGDLPIVELPEGQNTVTVSGTMIDNEMKAAQSAGIPLTQADSHLWYGPSGPNYRLDVDENGKFSKEINIFGNFTQIQYLGADYAGNTAVPKVVYYAREGAQYVFAQPDKESYKMGDKITYTFYANNLEKAHDFSMNFYYSDKYLDEPVNFKLADGLPEGSELVDTTTKPGTTKSVIDISIPGEGVSGDVALFEMTVDTNADEFRPVYAPIFSNSTMQVNGSSRLTTKIGAHPIYPMFSKVDAGFLGAEGLLTDAGKFDYSRDYTEVGAAISVEDAKGNSYPGRLESNGRVYFDKLPLTETKYTVVIDIPGHYTTFTPLEVGRNEGGIDIGESIGYRTAVSKPGDINKDNAIDIHDAILVEKHWGTDYRNTDINFDGTTDKKDFKLLEKYYLSENDFVLDTPDPQSEANGKTIDTIKKDLGITP
ncbi:subtilisin family serine protease [Bacillus pakistanensis]|uniref:Subtilisin family serine protease n=1 Tax=Rossellomorea pakistanensis TaxID=992288 RepID=A0ABS2NJB3_9BACI|nr:S8 family serine peptidase [Bacillus pakistanensis]MBM7587949.1 subtilisin family serine protease [Bacillus pakistanensis]